MANKPLLATPARALNSDGRIITRLLIALILTVVVVGVITRFTTGPLNSSFTTFVTIFLGIFIEAVPFLVAGSAVSGLIEVFVGPNSMARFIPRNPFAAAFVGTLLGFTFPVCECGVVPVTRRLYQKGLPLSVGVAFLLAAPVINPIVLLGTYTAFGWGPVLVGRFAFTILIAFIVGLLFTLARPDEVLLPQTADDLQVAPLSEAAHDHTGHDHAGHDHAGRDHAGHDHERPSIGVVDRFWRALRIGSEDFIDMARYLIIGSMLAAGMQTVVPQTTLLALGSGPLISVLVMMALAFVLSVCSTVDAFLALSFVNTFTTGSILSFLVFGPMVDIKSALMFLSVFRRRVVFYLILLPFALSLLIGVFLNLNVW
jgi:uncharacterized protein